MDDLGLRGLLTVARPLDCFHTTFSSRLMREGLLTRNPEIAGSRLFKFERGGVTMASITLRRPAR